MGQDDVSDFNVWAPRLAHLFYPGVIRIDRCNQNGKSPERVPWMQICVCTVPETGAWHHWTQRLDRKYCQHSGGCGF